MQNSSERAWGTEVLSVVQGDWRREREWQGQGQLGATSEKALRTKLKGSDFVLGLAAQWLVPRC